MTLFIIPFLICGVVLIMYRMADDITSLKDYVNQKKSITLEYSIIVKVLLAIHSILFPLRGFFDALGL